MTLSPTTSRPPLRQPALLGFYATSPQEDQLFPDYLSTPLYGSLEDFTAADLSADNDTSASLSPVSSVSPALAGTLYEEPDLNELVEPWTKPDGSLDIDSILKLEPSESPTLMPTFPVAANPMDLSGTGDVGFRSEGVDSNEPLFLTPPSPTPNYARSPVMTTTLPAIPSGPLPPLSSFIERRTLPPRPARQNLKRKSTSSDDSPTSSPSPPVPRSHLARTGTSKDGGKKTSHNMIEKRYRNNLNDKITALRDSVPSLRVMVRRTESQETSGLAVGEDDDEDGSRQRRRNKSLREAEHEELGGLEPALKLNKATILSKATEYIAHLERKNQALEQQNAGLETRVRGLEAVVLNGAPRGRAWI